MCSVAEMLRIPIGFAFFFTVVSYICADNSTEHISYREHKVHNIVLYPDKHSWCKATSIVQVVGHPGCNAVKMDNNVCVGACFSYIVPRTVPETPGDVLPYCDSCQPGHVTWKKVTLECNEGSYKNKNLTKYVEYIHDCNCGMCKDPSNGNLPKAEDIDVGDNDSEDSLINGDSLDSSPEVNQIWNSSYSGFKTAISGVLKTLNNEDESVLENSESKGLHRNVWKSLLEKVETSNSSIDSEVFNRLVQSLEAEAKVKFNYKRLKQALLKLKKYENISKLNTKTILLDSMESSKDKTDLLDLYSKVSPRFSSHTVQRESAPPTLDFHLQNDNNHDVLKDPSILSTDNQTTSNNAK